MELKVFPGDNMIVTDIKKCRTYEECEDCKNKEISKCMEVCPTNAIKMIDGKAFSCITCGTCAKECPTGAIKKNEYGGYYVNRKLCTGCGICKNVCPIDIIDIREDSTGKSYPTGMCVMCGLCTTECPYNARLYFDPSSLKNTKNKMLMERYSTIFKMMGKTYEFPEPKHVKIVKPAERKLRHSISIDSKKCVECGKCIYLCPKDTIIEAEMVDGCTRCNICNEVCPVDAIEYGQVTENCILCGNCISKCPKDVLEISEFKVVKTKEDVKAKPEKHCINCGLCVDKCPSNALRFENGKILYDPKTCTLCNTCVKECPQGVRINKGEFVDGGCVLCELCIKECPEDAISIKERSKFTSIDKEECIACGTCSMVCPNDAITVVIDSLNFSGNKVHSKVIFNDNCVICEKCAIHCPRDVIENTSGHKKVVDRENSYIRTDNDYCVKCGLCTIICPNDAIDKGEINTEKCEYCSACVNICPTRAIRIYRTWNEKTK